MANRKMTSAKYKHNKRFFQSALDALKSPLVILDEQGVILAVNRAWREFARVNEADLEAVSEGINYLDICDTASGKDAEQAQQAAKAIRSVISGEQTDVTFEYPCHSPKEQSWFYCHISRFEENGATRILVQHEDNTLRLIEQKKTEQILRLNNARFALINGVGQKISGVLELQGVLDLTAHLVHSAFGFYRVTLFTYDETTNELVMRARAGQFSDLFPPNHRIKLGSGMVGCVAQKGIRLLANDVTNEPQYANFYPDHLPTASEISLPLMVSKRVFGVMDVQSPERNAFSEADVSVLEILADRVAVAIENSHLYETAQRELDERKYAESALRQTEQYYRSLFENSPISLWDEDFSAVKQRLESLKREGVTDFRCYFEAHPEFVDECVSLIRLVDVNRSTLALYGAKDKKILLQGLPRFVGKTANPSLVEQFVNIATGSYHFSRETTNRKLDGSEMSIRLDWAVMPGYENSLEKVIVSVIDITEQKQAKQELDQYQAHLEKMIRERTAELEIARDRAEAANRAKSDFLAVMSHEIRTPLNGILGLTHLTQQTPLTEKQKSYLARLQSSGETLLAIINAILDFSKIEAGNMQLEKVEFNLDDVLRNLSGLVAYRAQEKGLELLFDTAPDVPRFLIGDPHRLEQVLLNLVGNAIKFTEQGEVVLKITCGQQSARSAALDFSVRDTGIGLSEEEIARLFQPFTQADTSISRKYGGTGLGLTISQRLIKMMSGNITIESHPGKGSTFRFVLQFDKQSEHPQTQTLHAEPLRGLRVLLIDDHAASLEYVKNTLESFAFHVTPAQTAHQGLDLLERQEKDTPYHLVIINLSISGEMSSLQTTRAIRQASAPGHIPIILLLSAEEMLYQDETALLDGYLIKPVTRSQLFYMAMQVFGEKEPHAQQPPPQSITGHEEIGALQGKHILLVEDNEINQVVADEMLKSLGVQVTIASSGEEGIWMLNNGRFDAVLMDIQMPGMDGYQATALIRSNERFAFDRLPVIATTAHALDSDREKAIKTGLNDFISKPIDLDRLTTILLRWLKPKTGKITSQEFSGETTLSQPGQNNVLPEELHSFLDTPAALSRLGGNRALYRRLLQIFHEGNANTAQNIRRALQTDSLDEARRLAHTLKGVAGTIGATELYESAINLETAITQNEAANIELHLELTEKHLSKIRSAITTTEKSVQLSKGNSISLENLSPRLRHLMHLLEESDAEAIDLAESIVKELHETEFHQQFTEALQQIRRFDFADALQVLQALAHKWNSLSQAEQDEETG